MSETHSSLAEALAAARAEAPAIEKLGYNEHNKYPYATGDDVIEACRKCLARHGLSLICLRSTLVEPFAAIAKGIPVKDGLGAAAQAVLHGDYALIHVSGQQVQLHAETPVVPERGRPIDKAVFAADTEQLAYVYRGVLGAKRGEALDVAGRADERDERGGGNARSGEPAPSAAQPAQVDPSREAFEAIRADIRAKRFDGIETRIVGASLSESRRRVLGLVLLAYQARSKDEFLKVAADIRQAFSAPADEKTRVWALEEIRPVWDALEQQARGAA